MTGVFLREHGKTYMLPLQLDFGASDVSDWRLDRGGPLCFRVMMPVRNIQNRFPPGFGEGRGRGFCVVVTISGLFMTVSYDGVMTAGGAK
jgi:hypothetical protein